VFVGGCSFAGCSLVGIHLSGVCLLGVCLLGVCLLGVCLLGVCSLGVCSLVFVRWHRSLMGWCCDVASAVVGCCCSCLGMEPFATL
jgi:hypothetical protein